MYITGLFLHWRVVAWIAFFGAILPVFMTIFWTPESPLWLIHNGKDAKALKSLKYFKNSRCVSFHKLFIPNLKFLNNLYSHRKDLILCILYRIREVITYFN